MAILHSPETETARKISALLCISVQSIGPRTITWHLRVHQGGVTDTYTFCKILNPLLASTDWKSGRTLFYFHQNFLLSFLLYRRAFGLRRLFGQNEPHPSSYSLCLRLKVQPAASGTNATFSSDSLHLISHSSNFCVVASIPRRSACN